MSNILWAYMLEYVLMFVELWKDGGWVPSFDFSYYREPAGTPSVYATYTIELTERDHWGQEESSKDAAWVAL